MENNFYVGVVHHSKRFFKDEYNEKLVLYNIYGSVYLDLISGNCYGTDISSRDYVIKESLILTNIDDHKTNYRYLLSRYKDNDLIRKKTRGL